MGSFDSKEQRASLIGPNDTLPPPNNNRPTDEESIVDELYRLNWGEEFGKFASILQQDWNKFVDSFSEPSTPRNRTQGTSLPIQDTTTANDVFFKVVLLGDEQTGKTALLYRYAKNLFLEEPSQTIVFDMDERKIRMYDGKVVKLLLLSHAGSENFLPQISSSLKDAVGFVLVYDTTNKESLGHCVTTWLPQIKKHATNENCPIFLLGTKTDLRSESPSPVDSSEVRKLASILRCRPLEVSSKDSPDSEVNFIFEHVAGVIYKCHLQNQIVSKVSKLDSVEISPLSDNNNTVKEEVKINKIQDVEELDTENVKFEEIRESDSDGGGKEQNFDLVSDVKGPDVVNIENVSDEVL